MKKVTLLALESSIKHWERMAEGRRRPGETPNAASCALCRRFLLNTKNSCETDKGEVCPVRISTGKAFCRETPYYKANDAWGRPSFEIHARKMIEFLETLRPTNV